MKHFASRVKIQQIDLQFCVLEKYLCIHKQFVVQLVQHFRAPFVTLKSIICWCGVHCQEIKWFWLFRSTPTHTPHTKYTVWDCLVDVWVFHFWCWLHFHRCYHSSFSFSTPTHTERRCTMTARTIRAIMCWGCKHNFNSISIFIMYISLEIQIFCCWTCNC